MLVKYVASRGGARMTRRVDQEGLIFRGVLGLLDATESYDPGRPGKKAESESYENLQDPVGVILDELRSQH